MGHRKYVILLLLSFSICTSKNGRYALSSLITDQWEIPHGMLLGLPPHLQVITWVASRSVCRVFRSRCIKAALLSVLWYIALVCPWTSLSEGVVSSLTALLFLVVKHPLEQENRSWNKKRCLKNGSLRKIDNSPGLAIGETLVSTRGHRGKMACTIRRKPKEAISPLSGYLRMKTATPIISSTFPVSSPLLFHDLVKC